MWSRDVIGHMTIGFTTCGFIDDTKKFRRHGRQNIIAQQSSRHLRSRRSA